VAVVLSMIRAAPGVAEPSADKIDCMGLSRKTTSDPHMLKWRLAPLGASPFGQLRA
jgi:hypothetical protein